MIIRPEATIENYIADLTTRIKSLEARQTSIPILSSDPTDSSVRLWMLHDGRLRGRKADDTIVEYAETTPGGSTSTAPPPAAQYLPSTRVYDRVADWTECWNHRGSTLYTAKPNDLFYGYNGPADDEFRSMAHFPDLDTEFTAGPAGIRFHRIELRISNIFTNFDDGIYLRIGYHNAGDSAPSVFSEVNEIGSIVVERSGLDAVYNLPLWLGQHIENGTFTGVTFNQMSQSKSTYGYLAGLGSNAGSPPSLRVVYVK